MPPAPKSRAADRNTATRHFRQIPTIAMTQSAAAKHDSGMRQLVLSFGNGQEIYVPETAVVNRNGAAPCTAACSHTESHD